MSPVDKQETPLPDSLKEFTKARYTSPWKADKGDRIRINFIVESVGVSKDVLDVGCYDGTIGSIVKAKGNRVFGVDISEKAVGMARQRGVDAKMADLDSGLPFADDSFDAVIAAEIIEHVREIDFLIDEFRRVLRPSGYAVVTTPNLASFGRRLLLLSGRNPMTEVRWTPDAAGHVRYFVKDTLFDVFRSHNFHIQAFASDVVNFDNSARRSSISLARLFPTMGRSLMIKANKE